MPLADELSQKTNEILTMKWDDRDGRGVPATEDVALAGGAVRLDAVVLYADMAESSMLISEVHKKVAAKLIRAFIYACTRVVTTHGATVTSFDGDRIMAVFVGERMNSRAAEAALQINHVVTHIIRPAAEKHFQSINDVGFQVSHCTGVDASSLLVVRVGQRNANDLVFVGRAANLAAKLSGLRDDKFRSFITKEVYARLSDDAKYGGEPRRDMWEERTYKHAGETVTVHGSNFTWKP